MKAYIVKQITEADFGCEGVPDGCEAQVEVLLRSEDGEEISVTAQDKGYSGICQFGVRATDFQGTWI